MNRDSRVDAAVWEQPNEHEGSVFRFNYWARFHQIPIQELFSLSRTMSHFTSIVAGIVSY